LSFNGNQYASAGASVVMSVKGDMVRYDSARERLGIGTANQILQVKSSLPSWETVPLADTVLTTQGDVLYQDASGLQRLGYSTDGYVLTTKGAAADPVWAEVPAATISTDIVVQDNNTTIGDYTTPSGSTCSSAADVSPTYDNSTFGAWTKTGTQVTESANVISFDIQTRVTNNTISTDLGSTLSDSAWVMRCKLTFDTLTAGGASTVFLELGLGDKDYSTAPDNGGVALDLIALQMRVATGVSPSGFNWGLVGYNSAGTLDNPESPEFDTPPTAQIYYLEMIRTSATSMTIGLYDSADFDSLIMPVETKTISSGVSGLRYLRVGNALVSSETSTGNQIDGTAEDFQIWDNATTVAAPCSNTIDGNTATKWISESEANPNIYVDMGSASTCSNIAVYPNSDTTETEVTIQSSTDAVSWTTKRTILTSNWSNGAYNYIRFNNVSARYWRVYGNSGATRVLSINEIAVKTETAADVGDKHGHLSISTSDTSLNNAGV